MPFPLMATSAASATFIHSLFEFAGIAVGFQIFRHFSRNRLPLSGEKKLTIAIGAMAGAFLGSKGLSFLQEARVIGWYPALLGGKTIVGGLLGGWLGVELAKKFAKVKQKTGDAFVWALAAGIFIGRIGCFLAGRYDGTSGTPSAIPWAVDFGEGIPRHPTQLYEMVFLATLSLLLYRWQTAERLSGLKFRVFLLGYFGFRFLCDFWKEDPRLLGNLSAIQWACLIGTVAAIISIRNLKLESHHESTLSILRADQ